MADGSIKIKIDGDDSGLRKTLESQTRTAQSAAASLSQAYQKAGMNASDAMKKAWADIKKAQQDGTNVVINGIETIIAKNEKVIAQKSNLGNTYKEMGKSAQEAAERVDDATESVDDLKSSLSGLKVHAKAGLADIKAGIDMATEALTKLAAVAQKGVNYNAQLEQMQTSFEVMTGSAEKAAEVVERLRTMGARTPFETTDLVGITQLLMQYGFTADDAIDKMSMLGDIAQGNAEAMRSIATGYAQMSSAGKVNLQDIKQMINVCHAA